MERGLSARGDEEVQIHYITVMYVHTCDVSKGRGVLNLSTIN